MYFVKHQSFRMATFTQTPSSCKEITTDSDKSLLLSSPRKVAFKHEKYYSIISKLDISYLRIIINILTASIIMKPILSSVAVEFST